jgi:hypothetical protein
MERAMCTRLALAVMLMTVGGASMPALSLDELVARHIEARGGLAKLQAIQSLRMTGKLVFAGGGVELSYTELIKRPGLARAEFSAQGLTAVQAWDGREGWQISPFQGRTDPERQSRDDSKGLIDDADIDGPLVAAPAKGSTLEYLGSEDVDGTDAHKIKVTQRDGDTLTVFLDPDYFLAIRIRYQHMVRGSETQTETDFGNYERVNGVAIPFSYETGPPGEPRTQKIVIDKAEINVPADAKLFAFPSAATSARE